MPATKTPSVASVRRALSILELVANSRDGLGVSAVGRKIQAPKSTAHTILLTLERSNFLQHNDRTGKYTLGSKFYVLGDRLLADSEPREHARPFLLDLVAKTQLTTHLAILDGNEVVYVEKIDAPGFVKMNTWVGRRIDARCTALGKALVAHLTPDRFGEMFRSDALPRRTRRSITSKEALKHEMSRIRDRGYAIDDEECGLGFRCVASPIFDRNGQVVIAIGMSGTTSQVTRTNLESLGALASLAARKISRNLGHQSIHSW